MSQWGFIFVIFAFLVSLTSGCIGAGPQLSITREGGGSGTPTGRPGQIPEVVPPLSGNQQLASGGGGSSYASERFKGYGSTTFVSGGRASSEQYRTVSPDMSLGQQKIGTTK